MSRILIIGDQLLTMGDEPLSREIGAKLTAQDLPVEYAAGHADALLRMRMRSFGVVITSCDSALAEDLALLTELRAIRPGLKCIVLARTSTPDDVIAARSRTSLPARHPTTSGGTISRCYPPSPGGCRFASIAV